MRGAARAWKRADSICGALTTPKNSRRRNGDSNPHRAPLLRENQNAERKNESSIAVASNARAFPQLKRALTKKFFAFSNELFAVNLLHQIERNCVRMMRAFSTELFANLTPHRINDLREPNSPPSCGSTRAFHR